jgi:hypothetical protein
VTAERLHLAHVHPVHMVRGEDRHATRPVSFVASLRLDVSLRVGSRSSTALRLAAKSRWHHVEASVCHG